MDNLDTVSGLRELCFFANLLVRHYEVVAVMENGSHDESQGVVVPGGLVSGGIGSDCLVTRNMRRCVSAPVIDAAVLICVRDTDVVPEAEKPVEVQLITLGPRSFTFYDALPLQTDFADHIGITVALLRQVGAEDATEAMRLSLPGNHKR